MRARELLLWMTVVASASCAETPADPILTATGELQIRPALVHVVAGETSVLKPVAFDAGTPVFTGEVEWSSLDSTVATVNQLGVVSAVAPGWARIVARSVKASQQDTAVIAVGMRFADIRGGYDSGCGLTSGGAAFCWGGEGSSAQGGLLGTGGNPTSFTPAPVYGGLTFSDLAIGHQHACGISDGSVYCWGTSNYGVTGSSQSTCRVNAIFGCHTPERAITNGVFNHIAVNNGTSSYSTCVSGPSGLTCWGTNSGARPDGSCSVTCSARLISAALTGSISLGGLHGCALDSTGRAFCWGGNEFGQLGAVIPAELCRLTNCRAASAPVAVGTTERFTELVGGSNFTCGLTSDGRAFCWGIYHPAASAVALPDSAPGRNVISVGSDLRFTSLTAGSGHACGLTTAGAVYCWGEAAFTGALGDPILPYPTYVTQPRRVMADENFVRIAATASATCGITTHGTTVCIGSYSGLGQGVSDIKTTTPLPLAPPGPIPSYIKLSAPF